MKKENKLIINKETVKAIDTILNADLLVKFLKKFYNKDNGTRK